MVKWKLISSIFPFNSSLQKKKKNNPVTCVYRFIQFRLQNQTPHTQQELFCSSAFLNFRVSKNTRQPQEIFGTISCPKKWYEKTMGSQGLFIPFFVKGKMFIISSRNFSTILFKNYLLFDISIIYNSTLYLSMSMYLKE